MQQGMICKPSSDFETPNYCGHGRPVILPFLFLLNGSYLSSMPNMLHAALSIGFVDVCNGEAVVETPY